MKLLNYLLAQELHPRENIEYYLAYTTLIYEVADRHDWRDMLNFDFMYRERQAALGFTWGSHVPFMELQLLSGSRRNRQYQYDQPPNDIPPRFQGGRGRGRGYSDRTPRYDQLCNNFASTGKCGFGSKCIYSHVPPRDNRPGIVLPPGPPPQLAPAPNRAGWPAQAGPPGSN